MSNPTDVEYEHEFPVAGTLAAIKEAQHPENLPAFQNVNDLFDDLESKKVVQTLNRLAETVSSGHSNTSERVHELVAETISKRYQKKHLRTKMK